MYYFQENIRVRQVVLGSICYFILLFLLFGCGKRSDRVNILDVEVEKIELTLNSTEGKWYYKGAPFNGYAVKYDRNELLTERTGYYQGKKQGLAQKWFSNGLLKLELSYKANKIDGVKRTWWFDGAPHSQVTYVDGKKTGFEMRWYQNGQLSRKTQFLEGRENGLQQAWLENGKIYVNYEAKNGRVFGLKRSNLCYELSDEKISYAD